MSNIKVRALAKGFYADSQVEPGQEFLLTPVAIKRLKPGTTKVFEKVTLSAEDQFSDEWMEIVVEEPKVIKFVPDAPAVSEVEINVPTGDSAQSPKTILTDGPQFGAAV